MLLGFMDWNPQLLREVKGRWNVRNVAISVGGALLGYLFAFLHGAGKLDRVLSGDEYYSIQEPFCHLRDRVIGAQAEFNRLQGQYRDLQSQFNLYSGPKEFDAVKLREVKEQIDVVKTKILELQPIAHNYQCPQDQIDMVLWWQNLYGHIFAWIGVTVLFILLVVGTYMLISNLSGEERRGTLNFLRFSPQSAHSILLGKLLGVPILLYLAAALMLPLHLWVGLSANMPLLEIVSFWVVLVAGCGFFYSAALLFALVCPWLGGFQAWLGSGIVFSFLCVANTKQVNLTSGDWLNLFSPSVVLPYLFNQLDYQRYGSLPFGHDRVEYLQWLYLPVGKAGITLALFAILNYALWTGWIWQGLNRRFYDGNTTVLSKRQSYWLVLCFEVIVLGLTAQNYPDKSDFYYSGSDAIACIALFHLFLFGGLIAILSPQRQTLQDWARYRRGGSNEGKGFWGSKLVRDLLIGEKSPAVGAIGMNLAIATIPLLVGIILFPTPDINKFHFILGVAFSVTLTMICATLVQLMLMMKTPKRSLWTAGTVAAIFGLPPFIMEITGLHASTAPQVWLFSTFPWAGIEYSTTTSTLIGLLFEFSVLALLNIQLTRRLQQAGKSETQALIGN
ncbi:MAG TPA: ABC transporter permease [Cyanobacteria bacterium UBA11149]|nr:ABC transporter permease [Cyanobacteria bacterium UBA11367]HBE59714.1 ABC transporter permease [Cyanobacteria bacterium UBA11366]HBK62901.1 ABC transporter permease [Cyanobacteria bacterium UBA11166]HBR76070.1 ABC transporter permease [Cyanobacteria bacterium UBA11159]HBS72670.1 ABC transporter permease [Cyanobacteria bacterium UBA11153]HBW92320.1 ABC transporter permease [Cyanobacteria bacterium UBA11149]HCA96160.1 ABC transporter permease [Cyanobacteria bacterium UBA9226]